MDALNYLLLVNIYLVLFYVFYALFLKDETFFKLNRIYLVGGASLSFLIPFLQSEWIRSLFITKQVEAVTQNISLTFSSEAIIIPAEEQAFETGEIILFIYLAGAVVGLLRFLWQLYKVQSILKSEQADHAFSFFNRVKVGNSVPNRDTVYDHELVHARQWHSADVILFEIISIINWFNPVVYLYRKAIKHIHEFTADEIASRQEESKSAYAVILLSKTFGIPTHQLTNSFYNQSLLKRRIIMLHKSKSTRIALLKYGLSAPLFAAMMVLSSATLSNEMESIDRTLIMNPVITTPTIATEVHSQSVLEEMPIATNHISVRKTKIAQDTTIFTRTEVSPEFPGGMKAFFEYLAKNFKYTEEARKGEVSGKVILQFVVENDGRLTEIKVLRGVGSGLDEEAVRVLSASPNWKPGIQNGKPVRVAYTLPMSLNTKSKAVSQNPGQETDDKIGITNANPNVLYIVDGKEIKSEAVKTIDQASIKSVNVLKGENGKVKYGDKGKDGVVEIYVNNTPSNSSANTIQSVNKITQLAELVLSPEQVASGTGSDRVPFHGLVIINGKEAVNDDGKAFLRIEANDIESVNVLKGEAAIKKYGDRGKEGAIEITLKKK